MRSGRRRSPAGWTEAVVKVAVDQALENLARRLHHPTQAEIQQIGHHLASACQMSLEDRACYILAAVARAYGLSDPEART